MATRKKTAEEHARLRLTTDVCRASHPHLFKPSKIKENDEPRYSIEMLFDKTKVKLADFKRIAMEAAVQEWGKNQKDWPQPLSLPYRDGDKPYGKKKEVKPEHEGMWVVRASTQAKYSKPQVVGRDRQPVLTESEVYPGCYVRCAIKANAYSVGDNEGINFILDAVQFVKDGEPFGGKPRAEDVFGVVEDEDEISDDDSFFGSGSGEAQDEIAF